VALTADEEGGLDNGVDWLLKNHRNLIDAEFVLNPDSGGVDGDAGKAVSINVEATEKLYAELRGPRRRARADTARCRGADNPLYSWRPRWVATFRGRRFPFELNPVTRAWLETDA